MSLPLSLRLVETRLIEYRRGWMATAVSSFLNPVLYLAAMGLGLGALVDRGGGVADLGTGSYVDFLAPGLLVANAMLVATMESTWPVMGGFKWRKTFYATLASPIGVGGLVDGHFLWIAFRVTTSSIVFAAVMVAFGAASVGGAALAVIPALLVGLAFAGLLTAFTATRENDAAMSSVFRFGVTPMFLFSGTFFPIAQLPGWMQPLAKATPLWHGVELARSWAVGVDLTFPLWQHLTYLVVLFGIGWWLSRRFLSRRLMP